MVRFVTLYLLFVCMFTLAKPYALLDLFGLPGGDDPDLALDVDIGFNENTPDVPEEKNDDNELDDEETSEPNPYWDCSNLSLHIRKCVLKPNVTLPKHLAEKISFPAAVTNIPIPIHPPKGVPADVKDFDVKGSLANFLVKLEKILFEPLKIIGLQLNL